MKENVYLASKSRWHEENKIDPNATKKTIKHNITIDLKNYKTTELLFNRKKLKKINKEIFKFENLKVLELKHNQISFLPDKLFELRELTDLEFFDNQIEVLPSKIGDLQQLVKINFNRNKIHSLPPELSSLQNLKKLNFGYNQISIFPEEICELKNLENIYLPGNEIIEIPKSINKLQNLESLDLWGNKIIELPNQIFELVNLRNLALSHNQIQRISRDIIKLKNLFSLFLSENQLKVLPKEIFEIRNLNRLTITGNKFSSTFLRALKKSKPKVNGIIHKIVNISSDSVKMDDPESTETDDSLDMLFETAIKESIPKEKKKEFSYEFEIYVDYWTSNLFESKELDRFAIENMKKFGEFSDLNPSTLEVLLEACKESTLDNYGMFQFITGLDERIYCHDENEHNEMLNLDQDIDDDIQEILDGFPFRDFDIKVHFTIIVIMAALFFGFYFIVSPLK
eukprot:gene9488-1694_t